jgi:hypothetical protein
VEILNFRSSPATRDDDDGGGSSCLSPKQKRRETDEKERRPLALVLRWLAEDIDNDAKQGYIIVS